MQRTIPIVCVIGILGGLNVRAADKLQLLPKRVQLATTEARQTLVVQRVGEGGYEGQVKQGVTFESSDSNIVQVESGVAIPVADGTATITATVNGEQAQVDVQVSGQQAPFRWSFRNHVESVLSKSGCNSGACHGAQAGQKGFRLTLFGFNLKADYSYLTRQARGRRIVPTDPGRSLILTKPTGLLPHKGGIRFDVNSLEYRVLSEWIAAGTPGPAKTDRIVERLEVLPDLSRQRPGTQQQLIVRAHFHDGHVEDVTRWAKYTSVNSSVASVGERGLVQVMGSGEGAIKVWYLNLNALAFLSVPYQNKVSPDVFANAARHNFVDELILEKLQALNLPPSEICDDATFLRRAFIDTIGTLPTLAETTDFLQNPRSDKRDALVDHLLARPEFVDYWSYKWSDLLLVNSQKLSAKGAAAFYRWIRERVRDNLPWDEFVRQIVTANGSTQKNGAANFYTLHQSPEGMAETVSQAFMGLSIQCAKCHNHPLEKWTNDQYYGFANLFSRVRAKGGDRVVFSDTRGELIQPSSGQAQPPRPLDARPLSFEATADRRLTLAKWLTDDSNPYFARAITNRVWANFYGVGLVEKVDDLRVTNPASNEKLLTTAAAYLVRNRYDLKELMRVILKSATYQRASKPLPTNAADSRFYSRYYPRRMKAEVLLDALSQVSGAPTEFSGQKKGTRALQLPDTNVASYFLTTFGRPDRVITCDCERSDEPSITQVFHIYNGNTLNGKLQAKENTLTVSLQGDHSNARLVERVYLSALSRYPTDAEQKKLLTVLDATPAKERRLVIEDLYWSILSSREFLFNH